jgi:hypothetical protein
VAAQSSLAPHSDVAHWQSPVWARAVYPLTSEIGNLFDVQRSSRDCEFPSMRSRFPDLVLPLENLEPHLCGDASGTVRLTTLF